MLSNKSRSSYHSSDEGETEQRLSSEVVNQRNSVLCLVLLFALSSIWTQITTIQQWASTPMEFTMTGATDNGTAPKSKDSLTFPTNISDITASTRDKLVIVESNDTAAMVLLPKEADSQTKDFQAASADQSYNSSISTNSVSHAITAKPHSSCSLYASGNFTQHFVPGALANYSDFLESDDAAICEFQSQNRSYWRHFPHAMQQLYACISWWNGHPSHPSVLAWSSKTFESILRSDRFVGGIITSLLNNNNLTILDLDTTPPPNNTVFVKARGADYTVQSPTHLQVFRDATVQDLFPGRATFGCPMNTTTSLGDAASPRIGILNRQGSRRLETVDVLAHELVQAFPMSAVTIKEFETASFADQVAFYSFVDILVSPHGAQLAGLPFMPNCGG
jgi:hypothetical protein